jgi:hypothetical protein
MSRFITFTWLFTLGVAITGIVPATVLHLHRLLTAARNIEQYTIDMLEAGTGIARNTSSISELTGTIAGATAVIERAESIERSAASIERALARTAADAGSVDGGADT